MKNKNSVLVVSNDSFTRELIRGALQLEGLEAIMCEDEQEAVESVEVPRLEIPIKLAVLEAFLPKEDGLHIVQRLQEIESAKSIPILMLLEKAGKGDFAGTRLNADAYVQKPFTGNEVHAAIHSMVKHHRDHVAPHPVTGIFGHPYVEQEVHNRLAKGEPFTLVCIDINHFKPFNDHYGIDKGNEVLLLTAKLVRDCLADLKSKTFEPAVAHVGGDDFFVILASAEADVFRQSLREKFKAKVAQFYSPADRDKGIFFGQDRENKQSVFPFMSLSMAVVPVSVEKFTHYGNLIAQANDLLRQAKISI